MGTAGPLERYAELGIEAGDREAMRHAKHKRYREVNACGDSPTARAAMRDALGWGDPEPGAEAVWRDAFELGYSKRVDHLVWAV